MDIKDIIIKSQKPDMYEKGTSFMWTNEHISKQLLNIHLNPEVDLGSRRMSTIRETVNWIMNSQTEKRKLKILDLGCGPGLYSEMLAKANHNVTGVDISKVSIDYAKKSAKEKNLEIEYINASYLEFDLGKDKYDLILLIYTDFGVLVPEERNALLRKVHSALKQNGRFIFDVLKDNDLLKKTTPKNWDAADNGFWSLKPCLALSESFLYEKEKVIMYQHIVTDTDGETKVYRFWTHFFNTRDLTSMLKDFGFRNIEHYDDVLPGGDMWNGKNVIFSIVTK